MILHLVDTWMGKVRMSETNNRPMGDKERIEFIIKEMALSNVEFSQLTGIAPATISHITSGRSKPTLPIFKSIMEAFPDLNPEWVFMGVGSIYKNKENEKVVSQESQQYSNGTLDLFASESLANTPSKKYVEPAKGKPSVADGVKPTDMLGIKDVIRSSMEEAISQRRRQIVEVRIFFDDGTYEAFNTPK